MVAATACGGELRPPGGDSAVARAPVDSAVYTVEGFQRLRWLDGDWQGFMPSGEKFYERYRFLNDSTIAMFSYSDSTFSMLADSSRVVIRNGIVANESASARWVASRMDSSGVDFAPQRGAANFFTWAREGPTTWNATLRWTDSEGRPQTVVYALRKVGG